MVLRVMLDCRAFNPRHWRLHCWRDDLGLIARRRMRKDRILLPWEKEGSLLFVHRDVTQCKIANELEQRYTAFYCVDHQSLFLAASQNSDRD